MTMKTAGRHTSPIIVAAVALVAGLTPASAEGAKHDLEVRIIHASKSSDKIDPKLKDLAREFKPLPFTSYLLKDEAKFALDVGSSGRMQMPGKEWLTLKVVGVATDGKLRIELEIKKLEFKAGVAIAGGAQVALRGPRFGDGVLILAVKRVSKT